MINIVHSSVSVINDVRTYFNKSEMKSIVTKRDELKLLISFSFLNHAKVETALRDQFRWLRRMGQEVSPYLIHGPSFKCLYTSWILQFVLPSFIPLWTANFCISNVSVVINVYFKPSIKWILRVEWDFFCDSFPRKSLRSASIYFMLLSCTRVNYSYKAP